jgi:uncharacterized protein YhaN
MAGGSVRQARALLDDAREGRSRMVAFDQRLTSLGMRADIARNELAEMLDERAQAMVSTGLAPDAPIHALEGLARQRSEERDVLTRALADMNQRFGELGQRLEAAREDHAFYDAKLEFHQLRCRLREQKRRLVVLLLARRMLEKSMGAWESRNQPAVYEQASRLFGQLTGGAWTHVSMTAEGRLVASSPDGVQREVHHLSLGTCQQLYLALRVAMLMQATSVGASIPVLADDILVNFDASRRRAAAQALSQLARARQVIVFTCHRETARILCEAASDAVFMEM